MRQHSWRSPYSRVEYQINVGVTSAFTLVSRSSARIGKSRPKLAGCRELQPPMSAYAIPPDQRGHPPDLASCGLRKPTICNLQSFASRTLLSYTTADGVDRGRHI